MQLLYKYNSLDLLKLLMAFLVIGIHIRAIYEVDFPQLLNYILETAVPFFFVCSGFFIQNKIAKTKDSFYVLKYSCQRYIKLYILWHIVYFPIALKFLISNERGFVGDLLYCLHTFLFVGEIIYSWPLWYLHALIVAIAFIYLLQKCRLSLVYIWIISIIMMLVGFAINYVTIYDFYPNSTINEICHNMVNLLGTTDRNGPFRGFALVTTGMMIRKYHHLIKYEYSTGIICIIISWLLYNNSLPLHLAFSGGGIFIIAASIHLRDNSLYSIIRNQSTLVYFIHMYIIVIIYKLFKYNIDCITQVYVIWGVTSLVTWVVTYILCLLSKYQHFFWIRRFIS